MFKINICWHKCSWPHCETMVGLTNSEIKILFEKVPLFWKGTFSLKVLFFVEKIGIAGKNTFVFEKYSIW